MRKYLSLILLIIISISLNGCYSFTGATIEGKTIYIEPVVNRAPNVVPSLAPAMNEKIRNRILSQTGLTPVNSEEADYVLTTVVQSYNVNISGVSGNNSVAMNRLTISISVDFKNNINPKANFKQNFSRMKDFDGNTQIQTIETSLISQISEELADDIFNKAFVNW